MCSRLHRDPCNSKFPTFDDTRSSPEFHGTKLGNSKFHGIPWNYCCYRNRDTQNSMEFHGIQCYWQFPIFDDINGSTEFHGMPWNLGFLIDMSSSMEFHGTSKLGKSKFHGIPLVSSKLAILKLYRIPWNSLKLDFSNLDDNSIQFWSINSFPSIDRRPISLLVSPAYVSNMPGEVPILFNVYQSIIQILFSTLIATYIDIKNPWNYLHSSLELFKQHSNKMYGSIHSQETWAT